MQVNLQQLPLPDIISAIGGLGTAAFGVLEALKPLCPSINRIGFAGIQSTVSSLTPPDLTRTGALPSALPKNRWHWRNRPAEGPPPINSLPQIKILQTIESNWVNGNDLGSQKAIAKSLIKLHLSAGNAAAMANATNVDSAQLTAVARAINAEPATSQPPAQTSSTLPVAAVQPHPPTPLTQQQADTWSRFDLIVTAMLDDCYQCADQVYRNWTRGLAAFIAVILALAGGYLVAGDPKALLNWRGIGEAFLVGLLATPLAPIAKDLSSALASAVNTMQLVKKV